MVWPESAPTNSVSPVNHTFPKLLSTLLQNSLQPIMNANKKHGLRPVLGVCALIDGKGNGHVSPFNCDWHTKSQITLCKADWKHDTLHMLSKQLDFMNFKSRLWHRWVIAPHNLAHTDTHTRIGDSPHCNGASCRCSRTSWLRTPSTLASPQRVRDGWASLRATAWIQ